MLRMIYGRTNAGACGGVFQNGRKSGLKMKRGRSTLVPAPVPGTSISYFTSSLLVGGQALGFGPLYLAGFLK